MAKQWFDDTALAVSLSRNLFEALPLLPKRLVRIDAIVKQFDMPFSHIQILCMLSEGEMTITSISNRLGIAKPNITPLLDALWTRGLVERERSETDRRVVNVRLQPKGAELAAKISQSIAEQAMQWPASFSVSDVKRINNALATLIEAARLLANTENK